MPFDPDKYLAAKASSGTFDPDSYIAQKGGETAASVEALEPGVQVPHLQPIPPPESWGHWAGRKALSVLPTAGLVAGTVLGAPEGGIGAIPGGAAGYTAGKGLEAAGRKMMGDQLPSDPGGPVGALVGTVGEGLDSATQGYALGKVLSPVGQYIADKLKGTGIAAAVRHLRPTPKVAESLGDKLSDVGEEALESGAIKPFQKVGDTSERLASAEDQAGGELGNIVKGSSARVNPQDISDAVTKNVINPLQATTAGKRIAQPVQEKLDSLLQDLSEESEADGVPVGRIEAEKSAEQGANNYLTASKRAKAADKAYASQLRQASEDAIQAQDPSSLPAFLAAKQKVGNLRSALSMANRTAGLTDGGTGLMGQIGDVGSAMEGIEGLATGNPIQAATPIARAITKGRVASTIASGSYGAGKMLQSALPYANPVAQAIASRIAPREESPATTPQSLDQTKLDFVGQQTSHSAQQALKDSQE